MRIERMEIREIALPLVDPFETSFGRTEVRHCILVRVEEDGKEGWGEAPVEAAPAFGPETTKTAIPIIRENLGPAIVGGEIDRPAAVPGLLSAVRGHPMTKAGIEAAIWDLECARRNESLAEVLGSERDRVPVGISLGIQDRIETLLERIGAAEGKGYRRVKIKIKRGWDLEVVREVRRSFPDLPLMVDANGAYTLEDAPLFEALDSFDLLMIEQPLHPMDFVDHGRLQARIETPICLDESIRWRGDVETALRIGALRIVNVKPARVGGLTEARAIHDLCSDRDIPLWCGGLLETGIGRMQNLALASLPGFTLPGDISESGRYYRKDIIDPQIRLGENGTLEVPRDPGAAGRVDAREIHRRTLSSFEITA